MALLDVRILSARCFGVYACGGAKRSTLGARAGTGSVAAGAAGVAAATDGARRWPHSLQNFAPALFSNPQPGQVMVRELTSR
jgi:hypothetical protein